MDHGPQRTEDPRSKTQNYERRNTNSTASEIHTAMDARNNRSTKDLLLTCP